MQDNPLPFITVVLPIRNEGNFIERGLSSVVEQDYPSDRLEVIVADGMSDDNTREVVASFIERYPNVRLIDNPGRIVPTGLNKAIAQARGDIIIRVDGHAIIEADYIRNCVAALARGEADCVGGPMETICETEKAAAIALAMSSPFGVGGVAFRTGVEEEAYVDTLAFGAYTREIIERTGEFDEELVRNQDDEYNYRLRKLGGRILLVPSIRSRYYSRSSLQRLWKQYFQYGYWKVRVMQKHPKQMRQRQFVPGVFVALLLASALSAPFLKPARYIFLIIAGLYLFANIAASVLSARKGKASMLPLLPPTFATLHFAYGLGFLWGLIKFRDRWGKQNAEAGHAWKTAEN